MYSKILVPLDGSRFAERALPCARMLAAAWGAALELATVAERSPIAPSERTPGVVGDESREHGIAEAGAYLEQARARVEEAGFTGTLSSSVISPGNIATSLVMHLAEVQADLCIMTTHGRGAFGRAWLGSTADSVIRHSPVPVLLIRPGEEEAPAAVPFRKILVPLDGSEASEHLLELAAPFAAADSPRWLLMRAIPPFVPGGTPYLPHLLRDTSEHESVLNAAKGYLEGAAKRFHEPGGEVEVHAVTAGQPAVAILRVAEEEGVDLIAMSTHGRGGVARLLLGSVADKVVRGSSIPVLLHREAEE